jgi:hypothetical protein
VVQEGPYGMAIYGGNLSNCERGPMGGNLWQSKTYKLELTFVNACSDLLVSHQMKCDCAWPAWYSWRFSSRQKVMKSLLVGTRR